MASCAAPRRPPRRLASISESKASPKRILSPSGVVVVIAQFDAGGYVDRAHNVHPSGRALDDSNFAAASDVRQLRRGRVGRDVDDALAQHDAAFGGPGGEGKKENQNR